MNVLKQLLKDLHATFIAGDLVKAEEIGFQALEIDPTSDYAHMILAAIYYRQYKMDDALKHYDLMKDRALLSKESMSNYANMKMLTNQSEEAEKLHAELVKNHPDFAEAWFNFGCCLAQQQKWEDAIVKLNKAQDLGYVGDTFFKTRGLCNNNLNRHNSAIRDFTLALDKEPDSLVLRYSLADIYRVTGEFEKSVEEFSKVIKKDLKYPKAMGRRLLARMNIKDEKGNIKNHNLAQAEADKIVELGLPFFSAQDKDGNPLKLTKIEITKDGKFNMMTLPMTP